MSAVGLKLVLGIVLLLHYFSVKFKPKECNRLAILWQTDNVRCYELIDKCIGTKYEYGMQLGGQQLNKFGP